ncbi:MAG TPA: ABC transporter permease, partial [Cyclobacteriaceae bacterium]|nr:ABC transporter permease [Cyclobacteriaceae bacterium]
MIKNYLLIIFRTLWKQKFYTFINLTGLSVGVAACLTITVFVASEISFDNFHEKGDRIYRLNTEIKFGDNHLRSATGYPVLAELFRQNYPEVEKVVRFKDWGRRFIRRVDQKEVNRENAIWVDSTFFQVFSAKILEGDGRTALKEANCIAISEKMAKKYFPGGSALGQSLIIDEQRASQPNENVNKITTVYEDFPANSHFHFDILRSATGFEGFNSVSLIGGSDAHVYLLLREGTDVKALEAKFPAFAEKYVGPQIANAVGGDPTLKKFRGAGNIWDYTLTPMRDIHLHSDLQGEFEPNGSFNYVILFSAIALFILVIACINFMNLSTARSMNRAREVGVRKALGSQRGQLMNQFLSESMVLTIISIAFAAVMAYLFLPTFNELSGKQLSLPLTDPQFYGLLLLAAVIISVMAGLYPAFYLSAFKPVLVLKTNFARGMKGGGIRSVLVVFQFIVSIFLIVATITIQQQLSYIQNKRLGFDKDQLISVHESRLLDKNIQSFKNEVLRNSIFQSATISGYLPVSNSWRSGDTYWKGEARPSDTDIEKFVNMQVWDVDLDYFKTMKMKLKSGMFFSPEFLSDSTAVILNETAVSRFFIEDDPSGVKVSHFNGNRPDGSP